MNTLKIASVLLTAAIMTGCASTSSEPTGSYARQVATAGGLRLEDQKVPKAQYDAAFWPPPTASTWAVVLRLE